MHFSKLLSTFVYLFAIAQISQANRVTTYKELKIVDNPPGVLIKIGNPSINGGTDQDKKNGDVSFLEDVDDHVAKLQAEAEEIRDIYNELVKSTFGEQLILNLTNQTNQTDQLATDEPSMLGAPRKFSADWVRAAINPSLLNSTMQTNKSQNSTLIQ